MKKLLLLSFFIFHFSFSYAQYMIYGVTGEGFNINNQLQYGTIFKYNPMTHQQTVVFTFNATNGPPIGRLLYASDSLLYGLGYGGSKNMGTFYNFNPRTNIETVLVNMDSTNGYVGGGGNEVIEGKDGLLYGTIFGGGKYGNGVLFSYNIHTGQDSIRCNFNDSVSLWPGGAYMELWQDTVTGILYGVTSRGGLPGKGGAIYCFNLVNNQVKTYYVGTIPDTNPWQFSGGLTQANNGLLYGMSEGGGINDLGTIYSFNVNSGIVQIVDSFSFSNQDGAFPNGNELIQCSNSLLYGAIRQGGDIGGDGVLFSYDMQTNTEKVLKTLNDTDGSEPIGRLIQDPDNGLLYGITIYGGDSGYGVLYSYDTGTGVYTKLLDFNGSNGIYPIGLTLVKDTSVHVIKDSDAGVSELKTKNEELRVYPNPGNGIYTFVIVGEAKQSPFNVEIYNVLGEKIYSQFSTFNSQFSINLSNQPNGVYLYRVITPTGNLVGEGKTVIQH